MIILTATVYLFFHDPAILVLGLWGLVVWIVPRGIHDRRIAQQQAPGSDPVTEAAVVFPDRELAEANETITQLEKHLAQAKQAIRAREMEGAQTRGHGVFRRVGLDQDCPRWAAETPTGYHWQTLHQEVGGVHTYLERVKRMLDHLSSLAYGLRVLVQPALHLLVLPACGPALLGRRAAALDRAVLTGIGPVAVLRLYESVNVHQVKDGRRPGCPSGGGDLHCLGYEGRFPARGLGHLIHERCRWGVR